MNTITCDYCGKEINPARPYIVGYRWEDFDPQLMGAYAVFCGDGCAHASIGGGINKTAARRRPQGWSRAGRRALIDRAMDHIMQAIGSVPSLVCVHQAAGMVTFAVADRVGVIYGWCSGHAEMLTALALLDGRPILLGHVTDADTLAAAIVSSPALDSLDAERLLADLQRARP